MNTEPPPLLQVLDALLMASPEPLSLEQLHRLLEQDYSISLGDLALGLEQLMALSATRGFELVEVAKGWRYQTRTEASPWVAKLWQAKPRRHSKAAIETLAVIAYQQPITRAEIEAIRGQAVSAAVFRQLLAQGWIQAIGQKAVPGRPLLYATTEAFLQQFNLRDLDDLPAPPADVFTSAPRHTFPFAPLPEHLGPQHEDQVHE